MEVWNERKKEFSCRLFKGVPVATPFSILAGLKAYLLKGL